MVKPLEEALIAATDIDAEKAEEDEVEDDYASEGDASWISLNASSQALMMAQKKESRFKGGRPFNAFVLSQNSTKDNEFTKFLQLLKNNSASIPPGTRIQLAVLTNYIDPIKNKEAYDRGIRQNKHWTAVDILVGENGTINSFTLDAANGYGYRAIHDDLKKAFPNGTHYRYEKDYLEKNGEKSRISIQTQHIGCQVFVTDHLKQLAQIDSETLYGLELPLVAKRGEKENKFTGEIKASKFTGGLLLTRLFRGMQTWKGLNNLPEDVKKTVINERGETLVQRAKSRTVETVQTVKNNAGQSVDKQIVINETIMQKNRAYKQKKRKFFDSLPEHSNVRIMEQRQGFTYLTNPSLFQLSDHLASCSESDLKTFFSKFTSELDEKAPKKRIAVSFFSAAHRSRVQKTLSELNQIADSEMEPEAKKNQMLQATTSLFQYLEDNNSLRTRHALMETIEATCPKQDKLNLEEPEYEEPESDLSI